MLRKLECRIRFVVDKFKTVFEVDAVILVAEGVVEYFAVAAPVQVDTGI